MSVFEKAWPVLKGHEGKKYTNHSWDPGGPTKYGITLKYLRQVELMRTFVERGISFDLDEDGDVDDRDVMMLEEHHAMIVYEEWWDRCGYGNIVDQQVATKSMDMSVNMGPLRSHRYIQLAVIACGYTVKVDGLLGTKESFPAINKCQPRELLLEMCHLQTEHYRRWCDAKPNREGARIGLHHRGSWPFVPGGYT